MFQGRIRSSNENQENIKVFKKQGKIPMEESLYIKLYREWRKSNLVNVEDKYILRNSTDWMRWNLGQNIQVTDLSSKEGQRSNIKKSIKSKTKSLEESKWAQKCESWTEAVNNYIQGHTKTREFVIQEMEKSTRLWFHQSKSWNCRDMEDVNQSDM